MNYLFVGGVWDGKRTAIPDGKSRVDVPHIVGLNFGSDSYHTVRLERSVFFVFNGLTAADAIERLINCYHPELVPEAQQ